MRSTETQKQQIRNALENGERLTPKEALYRFGCFRLGARIWDLKQDGLAIEKQMVDRGGAKVAQYRLA